MLDVLTGVKPSAALGCKRTVKVSNSGYLPSKLTLLPLSDTGGWLTCAISCSNLSSEC